METLFRYTDRLSGMEPLMTKNMKTKTLIQSFHSTHILAHKRAGNKINANALIDDVMEFMKLQEQAHDANEQKNKKTRMDKKKVK